MEDNFRLTLIVISAVAIVAIFAHGFWTLRKNKNPYKLKPEKKITEGVIPEENYDGAGFDYTGVSKPRVVGVNPLNDHEIPTSPAPAPDFDDEPIPKDYEKSRTDSYTDFIDDKAIDNIEPESFTSTVVSQTEPAIHDDTANDVQPEIKPEPVVHKPLYAEPVTQAKPVSIKTPSASRAAPKKNKPVKTNVDVKRDQLEINFGDALNVDDEPMPSMSAVDDVAIEKTPAAEKEALLSIQPEVIVLSVVAPEGETMSGAMLLPSLLTLGLKFGEMDIFHRHEDNAGNGKVTFSLANIMNPGTFNLDEIETFSTQGVSLFMTLPNAGDSFEVFEMMLNCAKQLALEFKGQVLDDKRNVMTKQTEQHYMSRIRDFTRKHRIATL